MFGAMSRSDRVECGTCGFPVDLDRTSMCPKCGKHVEAHVFGRLAEVDIAHDGERLGDALEKLGRALDRALAGGARGLKVIHGYGSEGRRGVIGPAARRWLRDEAARYRWKVARDQFNPGATLVWFE